MKTKVQILITTIIAGLTTLSLTAFGGQMAWLFELTSHFRLQYAVLAFVLMAVCLSWKWKKRAILCAALFLVNSASVFHFGHFVNKAHASPHIAQELSLVQLNLFRENNDVERVVQYLHDANPDVLALEELTSTWFESLMDVLRTYPHQKYVIREDGFGIGLFSRLPLEDMEMKMYGTSGVASITAVLPVEGKRISMVVTHPPAPDTLDRFNKRNSQLRAIWESRHLFEKEMILFGDFNITPWSHYFKQLVRHTQLKDTRIGFGIQPTWPARFFPMWIPLDHCFVSPGITVLNRQIGPAVGSDHYPLYVKLGIPE